MKAIIITQNDVFYLPTAVRKLIDLMRENHHDIVSAICLPASPYGKKENFLQKSMNTFKIFGLNFFIFYSILYIKNRIIGHTTKRVIKQKNINIIEISGSINSKENVEKIKSLGADILISIAGNQIFRSELLSTAEHGCINLHTALLPKYRGLMPTFWAMLNDEPHIGISVFQVDSGIDSGPIINQKTVLINNMSHKEIILKTKSIGVDLIVKTLNDINKKDVEYIDNSDSGSTYFGFPQRKDVVAFLKAGKRFF